MATKKDERARNFATVVYPDSAPDNWESIIASHLIPCFISPLHAKDIDPLNQPKKPHYHVMLMFEGKKSTEQVQDIFTSFGGVGLEKVNSIRSYARYMCHLDNPDKVRYNIMDVQSLCGADYQAIIGLAKDKYNAIGEMMDWCDENNILSFYVLCNYARLKRPDWFKMLCDNSSFYMKEYLQSRYWSIVNDVYDITKDLDKDLIV